MINKRGLTISLGDNLSIDLKFEIIIIVIFK
jgi:hypothetical protein